MLKSLYSSSMGIWFAISFPGVKCDYSIIVLFFPFIIFFYDCKRFWLRMGKPIIGPDFFYVPIGKVLEVTEVVLHEHSLNFFLAVSLRK